MKRNRINKEPQGKEMVTESIKFTLKIKSDIMLVVFKVSSMHGPIWGICI